MDSDNQIVISNLVSRSWFLNTIYYQKELRLLEKMAEFRAGRGKGYTEPETACVRKKRSAPRMMGKCQKYTEARLKGLPVAQPEPI